MVRMGRYKLVYDMLGNGELYDLEKDPSEMRNLYGLRKYARIRESLLEELLKWEIATEDPIPVPRNRYRFKRFEHNILSHPLPIHIAAGQHGETRCLPRHLLDSPCWPAAICNHLQQDKNCHILSGKAHHHPREISGQSPGRVPWMQAWKP